MNANTRPEHLALSATSDPEDCNASANPSFNEVLDARLSRRNALRLAVGSAGSAVLGSIALAGCGGGGGSGAPAANTQVQPTPLALNFTPVAKSTADAVAVPAGYTADVIYALGDPIAATTPDYRNDGTDTDFENRAGDHHDGMEYFGLNADGTAPDRAGSVRGLLVMNHEATSHWGGSSSIPAEPASTFVHADGGTNTLPRPAAEVDKEVALHGVSVIEVRRAADGTVSYDKASTFNRRVTPLTPVQIHGPARGNALMVTKHSTDGTQARGTLNNCGTGTTPWGTFLTGEENWAGYFYRGADEATRGGATAKGPVSLARYGRGQNAASRHGWETGGSDEPYARWDITADAAQPVNGSGDYRNELNTFGWIVEIDPYDKNQAIRKRTALGRFAHESAAFGLQVAGKPLAVYMGDDSRGEYIYKFVSAAAWSAADANPANRITTGDKYLDAGKLYVARFDADGTGTWVELHIDNPAIANYSRYDFADQGDVLINARLAADAVGATKMDRPEWCAVHPVTGEVYYTLTNNSNRKVDATSGSHMVVDAANPRAYSDSYGGAAPGSPGNIHGHIIRMRESGNDSAATSFTWDVYLFGAEAGADLARVNLSALTADQDFSSPDGLWFSPKTGVCFIQTDDGAYTDVTNCMMLAAIPGQVGDGTVVPLEYTKGDGSPLVVNARVGAKPGAASLRRFLVGPKDCEITGITETPDGRTLFVNIQHPGETITKANIGNPAAYLSHWPGNAGYGAGGATARPRSATIAIRRDDGGVIAVSGNAFLNDN